MICRCEQVGVALRCSCVTECLADEGGIDEGCGNHGLKPETRASQANDWGTGAGVRMMEI